MDFKFFILNGQAEIRGLLPGKSWTLPQGAVEYPNATALQAAIDQLSPPEDWDGFRQWRRQNGDYVALTRAEGGLVLAMEADIARGDFAAAAAGWDLLKGLGAVSPTLEAALMGAIQTYHLTSLAQALAAHNQGQP